MSQNASKMLIWNMALGWIGTRTVASEDEKTPEAVQCALYWDMARRQVLRSFPWNFAQVRAWLAEVPMPVGYEFEYRHAYAMPLDALKANKILREGRNTHAPNRDYGVDDFTRFIIVNDQAGKRSVLLTNAEKVVLSYTADIEDARLFDDLFTHVLARKLAADISVALLKNNASKAQELQNLYLASIPTAIQADANEGRERPKEDSWLEARIS